LDLHGTPPLAGEFELDGGPRRIEMAYLRFERMGAFGETTDVELMRADIEHRRARALTGGSRQLESHIPHLRLAIGLHPRMEEVHVSQEIQHKGIGGPLVDLL